MKQPRFILDTNICIYIARKRPPELLARFEKLRSGEAVISVITYGELRFGADKSQLRDAVLANLEELTSLIPVQPMPIEAAEFYGTIRAQLEANGRPIGGNDLWIAAHTLANNLVLVSNNTREFRRIEGLKLQNWVA
jgi:tRNA(fMet)-specific endonuclease VapC